MSVYVRTLKPKQSDTSKEEHDSAMIYALIPSEKREALVEYATKHKYQYAHLVKCQNRPIFEACTPHLVHLWWMLYHEESAQPVGFVLTAADYKCGSLVITHIFVHPRYRNKGTATRVIQDVKDAACMPNSRFDSVYLDCASETVPFYAARGFMDIGLQQSGVFHDMIWNVPK